jgi:uncharacterized protein
MKFEIHKSDAAQPYTFRIVASNGQTVAVSENYAAKASAVSAIESIKAHAGDATVDDLT